MEEWFQKLVNGETLTITQEEYTEFSGYVNQRGYPCYISVESSPTEVTLKMEHSKMNPPPPPKSGL